MKNTMKKLISGGLIVTTINNSTTNVEACDTAVLETAVEASSACPYAAPFFIAGAIIITGVTAVIGIKGAQSIEVYQTLGHCPPRWKKNTVIEKIKHNGKVVQRRFYGEDGYPMFDVDLTDHGTPEYHPFEHGGAHIHEFDFGRKFKQRRPGRELTQEEYRKYIKEFDRKAKRVERMRLDKDGR